MYVILEAMANVMLPYAGKSGRQAIFTFIPGKNKVPDEVFAAVQRQNAQAWDLHYGKFLRAFETRFDTGTKGHLNEYSEEEMLEIVESVKGAKFLAHLLQLEEERKIEFKPRAAVIEALKSKLAILNPGTSEAELNAMRRIFDGYGSADPDADAKWLAIQEKSMRTGELIAGNFRKHDERRRRMFESLKSD